MQRNNWKVISVDNFARETVADRLIIQDIGTAEFAEFISDYLQSKFGGEQAWDFYQAVPSDRKLWRGMEELI